MEKSFLNFKATHPEWQPSDPSGGSLYLSRLTEMGGMGSLMQPRGGGFMDSLMAGNGGAGSVYDRAGQASVVRGRYANGTPITSPPLPAGHTLSSPPTIGIPLVQSNLGESYLDAMKRPEDVRRAWETGSEGSDEEGDRNELGELREQGVLGLLGQIYERQRW